MFRVYVNLVALVESSVLSRNPNEEEIVYSDLLKHL